jgi:hypothetical protein
MQNPTVVALVAASLLGAFTGCHASFSMGSASSSSTSVTSKSSPTAAQPADYSALLINASDIPTEGEAFIAAPPKLNPDGHPGVTGQFRNPSGSRQIGDTILIQPDASQAAAVLADFQKKVGANMQITGTPQPAGMGSGGMLYPGTSTDGSSAVTTLVFAEGRADVIVEFHSALDDPIPPDAAIELGHKQDDVLKKALPG